jgi:gliding motility-associated-like protein
MKKITSLLLVSFLYIFSNVNAQVTVSSTMTPAQYVQNVLIGPGVQVSNVTYNGLTGYSGNQIGSFNYTGTQIPFASGLVMASGAVSGLTGPNNSGSSTNAFTGGALSNDPDLDAIAGFSTFDVGKLEFDFIPAGNTVSFNFLFGSEEYNEYVCGSVNDVFGFFVTALTAGGGTYNNTNLALIPGTNIPISINTVNNGTVGANGFVTNCSDLDPNWATNNIYFDNAPGADFQADGMTVLMNITFNVVCGESYHFKFAVADGGDSAFDSWVLLQSGSFTSDAVDVSVATVTGDSTVIEGCTDANFIFTRPESQMDDTLIVNYDITGNAIEGTDYNTLLNPVTFLPGQDTVIITLTPVQDGLTEGPESVTLTVYIVNICGDTLVSEGTVYILDKPNITINENDPTALCANDSIQMTAVASGGFAPYTYSWSNGQSGSPAFGAVSINGPIEYIVTATDQCGFQMTDTVTITLNQTLAIDSMFQFPATACNPTGAVTGFASGFSGTPVYNWVGPGANSPNSINASVFQNLSPGWYYFTVTDNVCIVNDSILLTQDEAPIANFSPSVSSGCTPLTVTFTNNSQNSTNYAWDFGNGQTANVNDLSSQTQTYTANSIVRLIASANGCSDTSFVNIAIAVCGCTDPTAINYDPNAQIDNGSCLYPIPTVEIPNVFTPDGDGNKANETYFLTTTNALNIEFTIFNRWGDIVFTGSGINPSPAWDGKANGNDVTEGVYFIQYKISGYNNQVLEGHGFLHLLRK